MGFSTTDAITSDEIAAPGLTWNRMTSTGVMRAPPPMPVSPITNPTMRPARAMSQCILLRDPMSESRVDHPGDFVDQFDRQSRHHEVMQSSAADCCGADLGQS